MLYIFRLIITVIYSILVCVFGSIYCLFSPRNPKHVATFGHMFGRLAPLFGLKVECRNLGLTFNHDAISEGQAALAAQGTGTTGSRMANGSYAPHLALEKEIAEFFNRPTAIVFSTGYTANLGVISALADHNAVVLLDAPASRYGYPRYAAQLPALIPCR